MGFAPGCRVFSFEPLAKVLAEEGVAVEGLGFGGVGWGSKIRFVQAFEGKLPIGT